MSRITGRVDEDGNVRQRIEFKTKSDRAMREMLRLIDDIEVTIESYGEESVKVTRSTASSIFRDRVPLFKRT